jgi:hypothetical protein
MAWGRKDTKYVQALNEMYADRGVGKERHKRCSGSEWDVRGSWSVDAQPSRTYQPEGGPISPTGGCRSLNIVIYSNLNGYADRGLLMLNLQKV